MATPFDINTIDKKFLAARPPKEGKNVLTPIARLSFPNLLEARAINNKPDSKKRFGCSLLIPPQCNVDMLKEAAGAAAIAKWGADKVRDLNLKSPFLQAEKYKYEGYLPGWTLIRATCLSKPTVLVQENGSLIKVTEDDGSEIYPGRWCTASVNAFAYEESGNRGVSFGLNNVMLLNHDESLGGKMRAEDEFEAVSGGDYVAGGAAAASIDKLF